MPCYYSYFDVIYHYLILVHMLMLNNILFFKQGLVNFNLHAQPLPLQLQQQIVQQNSPMMTLPSNLPLPAQTANIGINHASSGTSSNSNINLNPDSNLSAASYGSQPSDKELDVSDNCGILMCI